MNDFSNKFLKTIVIFTQRTILYDRTSKLRSLNEKTNEIDGK